VATSFTDIQPFVVLGGFSMYPLWVVKRGIPALAFIMLAAAFLPKAQPGRQSADECDHRNDAGRPGEPEPLNRPPVGITWQSKPFAVGVS
jgi:hypothetical protein